MLTLKTADVEKSNYGRKEKTLNNKILSIEDNKNKKHKIYNICGIKFKFRNKNFIENSQNTEEMDLLKKSYFYVLADSLFTRYINKNFDMSFKVPLNIYHHAEWSNLNYMINYNCYY